MYSGFTSGRVLDGELLYTKILDVNLFACKCKQIYECTAGTNVLTEHSLPRKIKVILVSPLILLLSIFCPPIPITYAVSSARFNCGLHLLKVV